MALSFTARRKRRPKQPAGSAAGAGGRIRIWSGELRDGCRGGCHAVVVIGGVLALIQFTGLKAWHAVLVLVAGFYLALSPGGPQTPEFLSRIRALSGH